MGGSERGFLCFPRSDRDLWSTIGLFVMNRQFVEMSREIDTNMEDLKFYCELDVR